MEDNCRRICDKVDYGGLERLVRTGWSSRRLVEAAAAAVPKQREI